jgi:aminopeptidase
MPDPRVRTLAELLCAYSLDVQPGDLVRVDGPAHAQPLFVELTRAITVAGGHPWLRPQLPGVSRILLERGSDAQLGRTTRLDEISGEAPDKVLTVWSPENTRALSQVPGERMARYNGARRHLTERFFERMAAGDVAWCGTAYPSHGAAQDAGMSLAEWEDFVYGAGHLEDADPLEHWRAQSARQAALAERLSRASALRIVAEGTDLTVEVGGRRWMNADGRQNFPDGEVYTSPQHERTSGHISFAFPSSYQGHDVEGVQLWFEDGRVVREAATKGADFLTRMLDTDEGARHLGEVAFGMNDQIQHATRDTLFDEKIGGTCHVAVGMAFPEAGGSNTSAIHWDLVCDLRRGGEVFADGERIFRDGRFL